MEENNKNYAKEIAALKSKISYLKSKQTKICKLCGKEFTPKKNLKEMYCSDECRKQAIRNTKHKNYLKYKQNPEFVEKNKKYLMDWRRRTGRVKPKDTVSMQEYQRLLNLYDNLVNRFNKIIEENKVLITDNYELRNKSFLQKLKDLF